MSELSAMDRAKVFAHLERSSQLGNLPENERADVVLHTHVYPEDANFNIPLSKNSSILNGHKLYGATLYEVSIVQQTFQKLRGEMEQQRFRGQ